MARSIIRQGFLCAGLLLLPIVCGQAHATAPTTTTTTTTVEVEVFQFKSKDLQSQVEEAMQLGKADEMEPILRLMEMHENNPDAVLKRLKPYLKDPDEGIRITIIDAARRAPHSPEALSLLISLIPDERIGHLAISVLYENYNCEQIVQKGGVQLKQSLLRGAIASRYTNRGYLLLSCYKDDPKIISFLERRRRSFRQNGNASMPNTNKSRGAVAEAAEAAPRDTTMEVVSLDLALVELGNRDAQERVRQLFAEGETAKLLVLLRYLKFVENKSVLLHSVELLKDKRMANKVGHVDDPNRVLDYSRVCDEALMALSDRSGIAFKSKPRKGFLAPRFSDEELSQAYEKLRVAFKLA